MYKQFMRYIAKIDVNKLELLVNNNVSLLQYEKTGKWIVKNRWWLKGVYKRLPQRIDIDEIIEEGKLHSEDVYQLFRQPHGRAWLENQFRELKNYLTT